MFGGQEFSREEIAREEEAQREEEANEPTHIAQADAQFHKREQRKEQRHQRERIWLNGLRRIFKRG